MRVPLALPHLCHYNHKKLSNLEGDKVILIVRLYTRIATINNRIIGHLAVQRGRVFVI